MYLVKTPQFIQDLFPNFTWRIPGKEQVIYLTFDDGPIPEVTPWVLEQLAAYHARATFFCVGENIKRYPEVFQQVVEAGHAVGNHTNRHLNGWAADNLTYFHDIRHCARTVKTALFRPPYGRMKPKQIQFLLSGDFDPNITEEQCLENVVSNVRPGSIVVFHDSLKAESKLRHVLPAVLEHFSQMGYAFHALETAEEEQKMSLKKSA